MPTWRPRKRTEGGVLHGPGELAHLVPAVDDALDPLRASPASSVRMVRISSAYMLPRMLGEVEAEQVPRS
jgi:hypothetical protein